MDSGSGRIEHTFCVAVSCWPSSSSYFSRSSSLLLDRRRLLDRLRLRLSQDQTQQNRAVSLQQKAATQCGANLLSRDRDRDLDRRR